MNSALIVDVFVRIISFANLTTTPSIKLKFSFRTPIDARQAKPSSFASRGDLLQVKEIVEERKAALDRIRQLDAEYRRQQRDWFARRHRLGNLVLNEEEDWASVYYNEQASERDETAVILHRARRRLIVAVENFLASFAKIPWVAGQRLCSGRPAATIWLLGYRMVGLPDRRGNQRCLDR
jgi:hypothetical protein